MRVNIELTEDNVKEIILEQKLGGGVVPFNRDNVIIETRSKQNYKSEWETAEFRVTYIKET